MRVELGCGCGLRNRGDAEIDDVIQHGLGVFKTFSQQTGMPHSSASIADERRRKRAVANGEFRGAIALGNNFAKYVSYSRNMALCDGPVFAELRLKQIVQFYDWIGRGRCSSFR